MKWLTQKQIKKDYLITVIYEPVVIPMTQELIDITIKLKKKQGKQPREN